jgi:hypothetical protein
LPLYLPLWNSDIRNIQINDDFHSHRCFSHLLDDVEALLVVHPAKDDVFPVQPGSLHCRDEELGSVRVLKEKEIMDTQTISFLTSGHSKRR